MLTKYGRIYVEGYKVQFEQIYNWLNKRGISPENAREDTFALMASCSKETLQMLGQSGEFCKACENFRRKCRSVLISRSDLCEYVSEGVYHVPFVIHRDKKKGPEQISMANDAFDHPTRI